jgi:putative phage-type endonuclease
MITFEKDATGRYIHTLGMPKDLWLEMRKSFIGASEWGSVLELSDYDGPYDVFANKVLGEEKAFTPEQEEAMEMGLALEPVISTRYAKATGAKIVRDNKFRICQQEGFDFLGASLDRIATMPNGERRIVEIKTVTSNAYNHWEDEVPESYYAQVQAQMFVSGIHMADFAILIDGRRNKRFEVPYDQEFIDLAAPRLKAFWTKHIIPEIPPAKTVKQFADALVTDATVELDNEGFDLCVNAKNIRNAKSAIEKQYKILTSQVKLLVGEASAITYQGDTIATWKRDKSSMKFDEETFAIDQPELYKKYLKTEMGVRRLLLK